MAETRVNLRHLLEDLRDAYPLAPEEVIVTELVANALDSGASSIRFLVDPVGRTCTTIDDGRGMGRSDLEHYHDIAATTKQRGRGIGFAGVGVKLALLLADSVVTETRRGRQHGATRWHLENAQRAPWRRVNPSGLVGDGHGTAVTIVPRDPASPLLRPAFVQEAVVRHFAPLLDPDLVGRMLAQVYRRTIAFSVNGTPVGAPPDDGHGETRPFAVRAGTRSRLVGIGRLRRSPTQLPEERQGLVLSAYGKVIKRGWEWVGLAPRNPDRIAGVIEAPMLAAMLTINKLDFLRDGPNVWKFYRFRRAVQSAVGPILTELGERRDDSSRDRPVREAEREMNRTLERMAGEFPALGALLGLRSGTALASARPPTPEPNTGLPPGEEGEAERGPEEPAPSAPGGPDPVDETGAALDRPTRRAGGLAIEFDDRPDRDEPAWLDGGTLRVNRAHPAFQRAVRDGAEDYHLAFATAWAIARQVDASGDPHSFVNRFLRQWAS